MRKLEAVSFVTFVILMFRRVVLFETVMVSIVDAGELVVQDIVEEEKNLKIKRWRL